MYLEGPCAASNVRSYCVTGSIGVTYRPPSAHVAIHVNPYVAAEHNDTNSMETGDVIGSPAGSESEVQPEQRAAVPVDTSTQRLRLVPFRSDCIYSVGEPVGWRIGAVGTTPMSPYYYAVQKNGLEVIDSGWLDLTSPKTVQVTLDEPATLHLEVGAVVDETSGAAGAVVAPHGIRPSVPAPEDFDAFWAARIEMLQAAPANPVITAKPAERKNVSYGTLRMDLFGGAHVHGQVAVPAAPGKYPAIVYYQWAGGPYPLEKRWVTNFAEQGWLAVNIQPHDVLPDESQSYYDALPDALKNYHTIGRDDPQASYYLRMYLADYRAVDYVVGHPQWDGRTLIVMGTSMGGQQSLWAAALHPRVTGVIAHVPAGADSNGPLHGRAAAYPFWGAETPQQYRTALYFDTVNCASRIRVPTLMSIGFIDQVAPPSGLWAVFNELRGYKEVVPLPDAAHNHEATLEQQAAFNDRAEQWLAAFLRGDDVSTLPPRAATLSMFDRRGEDR